MPPEHRKQDAKYECGRWIGFTIGEDVPDDCPQCGRPLEEVVEK